MIKNLLKQIYSFKINDFMFFRPFIKPNISSLGDFQGVNFGIKREQPIIVSIYSNLEQIEELPMTIYSLLNQTIKPDKIILWVDERLKDLNNLPYDITQFIKNGLEIEFVRDLGCYTNKIYPIKKHPSAINVTAESGFYYRPNWLKILYLSYISHNNEIQVHNANLIKIDNKKILPFNTWEKSNIESASYTNYINKIGGILFPPNCFSNEYLREDIFAKYASNNDELWCWIMALVHNKKIRIAKSHIKSIPHTNFVEQIKTFISPDKDTKTDEQIEELLKFYKQNVYKNLI